MPWSTSARRKRLPVDWPIIRRRILNRDGHRCTDQLGPGQRCPSRATDVDHIINNDDHRDTNLTSLCRPHHNAKSAAEGHAAMRTQRAAAKHPTERHPGLL